MELLKLIGVLFVVVGFILKWGTIATVVAAGIITGLVAVMNGQMTFIGIFETLGSSFISQRTASLFGVSVGIIGICERYGLKDKAADAIKKLGKMTLGTLLSTWLLIRTASAAFSLRLGGHVQPMAEGAAAVKYGEVDEKDADDIKGLAAATENFGNFFGQNCFLGASGTLLIASTLTAQGNPADALQIATASWPICICIVIVGAVRHFLVDVKLNKKYGKKA